MREITHSTPQQIPVSATLDVQSVEQELNELWQQNTGATDVEEEGAVMRARVLNLLVYVPDEAALAEVNEFLNGITAAHPCRAIVMLGEAEALDQDIEMFMSAHCISQTDGGGKNLCGEQLTLKARGRFAVELPSAAIPLLVPDLPVFLWWYDAPRLHDQIFAALARAVDRIVIDSADFRQPYDDVLELIALMASRRKEHAAISDLNWARLTSWRTLLASFYDVEEYRASLSVLNRVRIEYVPYAFAPEEVVPKALILAGWLASRLGWRVVPEKSLTKDESGEHAVVLEKEGRQIALEFVGVARRAEMQGWIARIELSADSQQPATFVVLRTEDGRYLETDVGGESDETHSSRLLIGGDKTDGELLASELAIIGHDRIYEGALTVVASMLKAK